MGWFLTSSSASSTSESRFLADAVDCWIVRLNVILDFVALSSAISFSISSVHDSCAAIWVIWLTNSFTWSSSAAMLLSPLKYVSICSFKVSMAFMVSLSVARLQMLFTIACCSASSGWYRRRCKECY